MIKIEKHDNGLKLTFKDNGIGFNTTNEDKKSGIGLQNIKSRVAILNGQLRIESSKNSGSIFTINCQPYG